MSGFWRRSGAKVLLAVAVLAGGVVAVIAGYYLGSHAMESFVGGAKRPPTQSEPIEQPAPGPEKPPVPPPAGDIEISFRPPAITLFRVQVGAFSSRDNAIELASELRRDGVFAHVGRDQPYRVIVAAASDRDALQGIGNQMERKGLPMFVGQWSVAADPVKIRGPEDYLDWYQESLLGLGRIIPDVAAQWARVLAGSELATAELNRLEDLVRGVRSETTARQSPQGCEEIHSSLDGLAEVATRCVFELRALVPDTAGEEWQAPMGQFLEFVGAYEDLLGQLASGN